MHTSLRVLVQPFGETCQEKQHWIVKPNPDCPALAESLSTCACNEIFDWVERKCVDLCPEPLILEGGDCVTSTVPNTQSIIESLTPTLRQDTTRSQTIGSHSQNWQPNNKTVQKCKQRSHEQLEDIVSSFSDYDSLYLSAGLQVTEVNSSEAYCVSCSWYIYDWKNTSEGDSEVITSNGDRYSRPFYHEVFPGSVAVCRSTTEQTLLGQICSSVEATATAIMLFVSIICLSVMVIVYSILPTLHNVPGYIVLSKVRDRFKF